MILNELWLNYIQNKVITTKEKELLKVHHGKIIQLSCEAITIALKVAKDGSLHPVHQAITADAKITFSLKNLTTENKTVPQANGDSELLAAFAEIRKNKDLSFVSVLKNLPQDNLRSLFTVIGSNCKNWRDDSQERMDKVIIDWLINERKILVAKEENKIMAEKLNEVANRVNAIHNKLFNGS